MDMAGKTKLAWIQFSSSLEEKLEAAIALSCWIFPSQTQTLEEGGECGKVGGGQWKGRERGRQRIPSRLLAVRAEPDAGLSPRNLEILT